MNVYDFDNTIYDGESSFDFFMCCVKKNKRFLRLVPLLVIKLIKYKMCLITIDELTYYAEKYANEFFRSIDDIDKVVSEFWDTHIDRIKLYYKENQHEDDVVISASADFLLEDICSRLGIKNLICSKVDRETGKLTQLCFRANKVDLFYKHFPNGKIEAFYTDSMNDKPIIDISRSAYLVKGDTIKKVK